MVPKKQTAKIKFKIYRVQIHRDFFFEKWLRVTRPHGRDILETHV